MGRARPQTKQCNLALPFVEHLDRFGRVAVEVHSLHVVSFRQRVRLFRTGPLRRDLDHPVGLSLDPPEVPTELIQGRSDDLPHDGFHQGDRGFVSHAAVGAEVAPVGWRGRLGFALRGQPLEFPLTGRALPAEEAVAVERQRDAELDVAHGSPS